MPSPPSPTSRTNSVAPPRSTLTGTPGMPSRSTLRAKRRLAADVDREDDAAASAAGLVVAVHADDGREALARRRQPDDHLAHGMAVESAGELLAGDRSAACPPGRSSAPDRCWPRRPARARRRVSGHPACCRISRRPSAGRRPFRRRSAGPLEPTARRSSRREPPQAELSKHGVSPSADRQGTVSCHRIVAFRSAEVAVSRGIDRNAALAVAKTDTSAESKG